MKHPLLGPLAAIASGILVFRFVPFGQSELVAAIGAFLLLGLLALWRGSNVLAGACCLLGLFFAGAFDARVHVPGPPPAIDATGREVVIVEGCVVEPPAISGERERFILELDRDARAQVTLYLKPGQSLPALHYGQKIELDGKVREPRNFGNPGAFDYRRYLARQYIYWTVSAAAGDVRVLPGACGSWFQKAVMDLRAAALARIDRLYPGDSYQSGMMQAILIGQSFQLQRVWTEQWRSTGTFHAIVISGTHVAVLAAFFLFLLRICFVPESIALLVTVMAAWLYALVTGWQAPCVRSAAGLTLFMVAGYFYRERRIMNLLAAVALGFLLFDPDQLFDASFQLTFLAVGFLAAFASPAIAATSGPLANGLRELADKGRDLHLEPRAAQFRIEMRLLIETLRVPVVDGDRARARSALRLRNRAHVGGGATRPRAADGGLLSPPGIFRTLRERLRCAPDGPRGAGRVCRDLHGMGMGGADRGRIALGIAEGSLVSRQPGAELADSDSAGVARRRTRRRPDCGRRSGARAGAWRL